MANETIVKRSSFGEMIPSDVVATNTFADGTRTAVASIAAITTNEKDYPTLDFKLKVTAETFADNDVINLYRVASDGTDTEDAASTTFNGRYVGSFNFSDTSTVAYLYGIANIDQNDTFIWENKSANSVTASLEVRTRSVGPA